MNASVVPRPQKLPRLVSLLSDLLRLPLFTAATAVFGSASLLISVVDRHGRLQHAVAHAWARVSVSISGGRVLVIHPERLQIAGPAVLACNHLSYMDTPVIFGSLPMQFRIVAREGLWKVPFIGWYLNRSGQIPVNTTNPRASIASLGRGVKTLKAGMPLFIFPEGGRSKDGLPGKFLNGPAFMAIRGQVPVLPLALVGTYELLPMHAKRFFPGDVLLLVGEPIETAGLTLKDTEALTQRIADAVAELYFAHTYLKRPMMPDVAGQSTEVAV